MAGRRYNVLFLCIGNSARSVMAECVLNRIGVGRFDAFSAGSHPARAIHPQVSALLHRRGYPLERMEPRSWLDFGWPGAPRLDFVIGLAEGLVDRRAPPWVGRPATLNWRVPDPETVTGPEAERAQAFCEVLGMIVRRLSILASLPDTCLDRLVARDDPRGHALGRPPASARLALVVPPPRRRAGDAAADTLVARRPAA